MLLLSAVGSAVLCLVAWRRIRRRREFQRQKNDSLIQRLVVSVPPLSPAPNPPIPLSRSEWFWVDTPEMLSIVAARIQCASRIALDLEHHSVHTYSGLTCLLQLSDGQSDYIIDAIRLRESIASVLGPLLESPAVLKIVHGGRADVLWLLRDFGVRMLNIFDTEKACQALELEQRSLGYLLQVYCGVAVDKSLQRADWRQRPLSPELLEYARTDVHYLLYIADFLGQELMNYPEYGFVQVEHRGSPFLRAVHASQSLSLVEWMSPPPPEVASVEATISIMKRYVASVEKYDRKFSLLEHHQNLDRVTMEEIEAIAARVHALCLWRDKVARSIDEGLQCILPDAAILRLSEGPVPQCLTETQMKDVLQVLSGTENFAHACRFPSLALRSSNELYKILHGCPGVWEHTELAPLLWPSMRTAAANGRQKEDPDAVKERLGNRFGMKKPCYENCRMLSVRGELLCYTDRKRLLWYVKKGLAEEVDPGNEPLTVRLLFEHRDDDQRAGVHAFYSTARANRCVACGAQRHYLRYRVLPACYRRAMPARLKSHRSHDVVLLCLPCHDVAQAACERTKREIAQEMGVPLSAPPLAVLMAANKPGEKVMNYNNNNGVDTNHPFQVRKAALALQRASGTLPESRRLQLQAEVSAYVRLAEPWLQLPHEAPWDDAELWAGLLVGLGPSARRRLLRRWVREGASLPADLMEEASSTSSHIVTSKQSPIASEIGLGHAWHGRTVVEYLNQHAGGDQALAALCARFRKTFVDALKPQYLPSGWTVDHTAPRAFGEHSVYCSNDDGQSEAA